MLCSRDSINGLSGIGLVVLTRRHLLSLVAIPAALSLVPTRAASPQPIVEAGFVPIGGIDQWIEIRGHDRSRPAILFLHGGPCETQSPYLSLFSPWEERYVVAQWDQRGAGRTYVKNDGAIPNPTFEQLTRDAVEVGRHVQRRLGVRKLILVGHSWGSMLGLSVVRKHPELFSALVGTGQVVSGRMIIDTLVSSAITRAQAAGDAQAVADLKRFGRSDLGDWKKLSNLLFKWAPPFSDADLRFLKRRATLVGPSDSPTGVAGADSGAATPACLPKFMPYVYDFDASAGGFELAVPFFVIQGREDNRALPDVARAFLRQVHAPSKRYTLIDGGHFACFDNPAGFLKALHEDLRSLGIS